MGAGSSAATRVAAEGFNNGGNAQPNVINVVPKQQGGLVTRTSASTRDAPEEPEPENGTFVHHWSSGGSSVGAQKLAWPAREGQIEGCRSSSGSPDTSRRGPGAAPPGRDGPAKASDLKQGCPQATSDGGTNAPRAVHLQGFAGASQGSGAAAGADRGGLRAGQRVRIAGLENARHLNGEEGVLQMWDSDGARWVVRLRGGEEKRIRPANLSGARGGRGASGAAASGSPDAANQELEGLLLQTNWSAIYQLFHQRFGIATLARLERGYAVKAAVEMTLSIVAKCFALLRSDPSGRLHCTPLHIAALQSSTEAAEVIVRDLPKVVEQTHHPSNSALCPLHIAILCGAMPIVELLLDSKANPNVRTLHDVCPVHLAASSSKELCQLLLAYQAEPQKRDVMGSTALHYAASFKQHSTLEVLLNSSQNSTLAIDGDQKRVTPLHISCALYSGDEDLAAPMALLAGGAKPWQTDVSGASAREVVQWSRDSALQQFFERNGDRAQNAAQQWLEDQQLLRRGGADDEGAVSDDEDGAGDTVAKASNARSAVCGSPSGAAYQREARVIEKKLAAEVEELKRELEQCRDKCAAMEELRQELEHSREKSSMLEKSSAHQQKLFDDLQALCESAQGQHQAQLEDVQRRHATERAELEERMRSKLEAVRLEAAQEAEKQLESRQRALDRQREDMEAHFQDAVAAATAASKLEAPSGHGTPTTEALSTNLTGTMRPKSANGQGTSSHGVSSNATELQQQVEQAEHDLQKYKQSYEQEQTLCNQKQKQLQELQGAIRGLCAKHQVQPRQDEDRWATEVCADLLGPLDTELGRIRGESDGWESMAKALQDQMRQEQEELAGLRSARAEADDECARLTLKCQEVENRNSAAVSRLETQRRNMELQYTQELSKARSEAEAQKRRADTAEGQLQQSKPTIDKLREQIRTMEAAFAEEQVLRKKYHNQIQDYKGAIRVFCRFRPFIKRERDAGDTIAVRKIDAFSAEVARPAPHNDTKAFSFDAVFDDDTTQEEVFADCKELVQSAVDGYNVTIFAYGQTGAGKTHTMYGSDNDPGLAPRSIHTLFNVIRRETQRGSKTFSVKAYMIEVYKQDIIDLFDKSPPKDGKRGGLEVKRDVGRGMMFVDGATELQVSSPEELKAALAEGEKKRHVTATKMNSASSRSHLLLSIIIQCAVKDTDQVIYGKITLCDLAGSERPKKSEVSGDALKEAIEINKSLSALGDVIEALTKGSKMVPYRNHKLTMLMQDSLGGSAKTLMFVNCSPAGSNTEETQMSLKWASRARQVTNDVKRNCDSKEVARLKQVIAMMSQAQNVQQEGGDGSDQTNRDEDRNAATLHAGSDIVS